MAKTVEELAEELAALQVKLASQQDAVNQLADVPKVTVVPSSRKLSKYDGSGPVEDWIEEATSILDSNSLSGKKAGCYVFTSLEGNARDEIRGRGTETRESHTVIFDALREVFGEKKTAGQLRQSFYSRHQEEGESFLAFSHGLTSLADRLIRLGAYKSEERDQLLRDQFVEGICNPQLRWELGKMVETKPDCKFSDVRAMAERWSHTTGASATKSKPRVAHRVNVVEPDESDQSACSAAQPDVLAQLVKLTEQNQQLIAELAKRQVTLETRVGASRPSDAPQEPPSRARCYYCKQLGHYRNECPKLRAANERRNMTQNGSSGNNPN